MLRLIAAFFFALDALGYACQSVWFGITFLSFDVEPDSQTARIIFAAVFVGFFVLGTLFNLASAVLLYRSRGRKEMKGSGWGTTVVVLTSLCSGIFGLIFIGMALLKDWGDLGLSERGETTLVAFSLALGSHFLFLSILGVLAVVWPYRKPIARGQIEPAIA